MKNLRLLPTAMMLGALALFGFARAQPATPQAPDGRVVRIAELEIDPARLQDYLASVREEMTESIRVEPGVLAIYAVALQDKPNHLRFFEIYANDAAYQSHIASPHFRKYVADTQPMIVARQLFETNPVQLSAQPR